MFSRHLLYYSIYWGKGYLLGLCQKSSASKGLSSSSVLSSVHTAQITPKDAQLFPWSLLLPKAEKLSSLSLTPDSLERSFLLFSSPYAKVFSMICRFVGI